MWVDLPPPDRCSYMVGGNFITSVTGVTGGTGMLLVQPGGSPDVAQDIVIFQNGQVRLEGGELTATSIGFQGSGQFHMTRGRLSPRTKMT